jgi:hypothetical protein
VLQVAEQMESMHDAREKVVNVVKQLGLITVTFECNGKGTVTFSMRQHTKVETRTEVVCWVSESLRPFKIFKDCGFQCLMKTGQAQYYFPLPVTISCNVKTVFACSRERVAKLLQVCYYPHEIRAII